MTEPTMEEYMTKTREDYGLGIVREKFDKDAKFELKGLDVPTKEILDSKGGVPTMKADDAKKAVQEMAYYSKKWHHAASTKNKRNNTSDGLGVSQAQPNNLRREIKKVNESGYVAQVACELCDGPHSSKDCSLKEEGKTF
uniref:Uncharacterized protein n=1 Tax=Tanacetum cinerariifolium TaxID=118510 RepID=A0A6L2LP50_TANCI|nr:hypothetical protein [Tanacetum cinerariifolium]